MFTYSNDYWEVNRRFQEFFLVGEKGLRGVGYAGGGRFSRRNLEENFHEGGARFFGIFKKSNGKINVTKIFQLKVRSSIKTYNEQKLLVYEGRGQPPPQYPASCAKF